MEDFYFAYEYDGNTATRLYRFISGNFERYNPQNKTWESSPEQSRIFIGEDIFYDEITEEEAYRIEAKI